MVLPGDLTHAIEMGALVVGSVGLVCFLLSSPPERKHNAAGGISALLLLGVLLAGCAPQPQAAPNVSSSPNPDVGKRWTTPPSPTQEHLGSIVWSGSQYVAVGEHGTILTSADGHSWTRQAVPVETVLQEIVWSGSQYVAVGWEGTILTSADGRSWTKQSSPTNRDLLGIAWSGSQYVAVGLNGTIITSP